MAAPARRNFHVPLPEKTYDALRREADALGIPATMVVREAVECWLEERKSKRLREEIAAYANEVAGTSADLDTELSAAAESELKTSLDRP